MTASTSAAALARKYADSRRAVAQERSRLEALANQLRRAAATQPLAETQRPFERLLRSSFFAANIVNKAIEEGLFGDHTDGDNDSLIDTRHAQEALGHAASSSAITREWGERELATLIEDLEAGIALLDQIGADTRQILQFDAGGSGTVAEVFGDLSTAAHVAVIVPGMGTTVQHFETAVAIRARRLHEAATALANPRGVAVVGWLGYEAPRSLDVIDAVTEQLAVIGARSLSTFVGEITTHCRQAHRSVVAHSYGSVVAGVAAREHGLEVDDLVVLGSPGLGVEHAKELRLNAGGTVWAVRAQHDPITTVPRLQLGRVKLHGASPYDELFGSRVVIIADEGHSSYLTATHGVHAISQIVTGGDPR